MDDHVEQVGMHAIGVDYIHSLAKSYNLWLNSYRL